MHSLAAHIISSSLDIIIAVDRDRRIVEFNRAAEIAFGYSSGEMLGEDVSIIYADPQEGIVVHDTVRSKGMFMGEITNMRKDGTDFRTFLSATFLRDNAGNIIGVVGTSRDITEYKKSEDMLLKSERFLNNMVESIKDPFSIVDRDYRIVKVNGAYAQMRNRRVDELIGERCHKVLQQSAEVCEDCIIKKTFDSSDPCAKEKKMLYTDGAEAWVEIYTYPIMDDDGVSHVIEYTRDITDRKRSEKERMRLIEKLEYLSSTDVLSGLLNRRALLERLNSEAERALRYGSELSLILCDIDFFKEINDAYGHAEGDMVLKTAARVLEGSLRKSDVVGRYGGDEFMLILPETSLKGAEDFAERVRSEVENTRLKIGAKISLAVSLSLGVTGIEAGAKEININSLIRCADTALYAAKQTGRNKVCVVRA